MIENSKGFRNDLCMLAHHSATLAENKVCWEGKTWLRVVVDRSVPVRGSCWVILGDITAWQLHTIGTSVKFRKYASL